MLAFLIGPASVIGTSTAYTASISRFCGKEPHHLPHLALLFHSEQEPLFHQLHQCFFRKARLTRDSIPQIAPSNGRRAHTPLPFWIIEKLRHSFSDVLGRVHREFSEDWSAVRARRCSGHPVKENNT